MAKTLEELRKKYSPSAKVEKEPDKLDALRERYSPSAKAQAESKKQVVLPEIPSSPVVQEGKVQRTISNPRFQTVAERAENKPASTNPRARGNSGKESTSRVGKAAQSIGLNTVGSVQMMGDTLEKAGENAKAYQHDSGLKDRADEALNAIKLAKALHGEGSPEHLQAEADYDAIRQEIVAYQNAPDKAVSKDSRGYQTMQKAQQLQEEALEGTTGVGRFLGETAFSVADNLATVIASGGNPMLAATMMGVKAAAGKARELTDAGVNASSAFTRGAVSGAIEAATEKIPVDNLMDLVKSGGKSLLVNVLKQAGVEGTEEGFSYLFNYLADKLAQDPNAQFNPNDLLKQIASGAVSGLVFGAGGTAINALGAQQSVDTDPVMEQAVQMLQQKMGAMQAPAAQETARPAANEVQAMQTPAAVQTPAAAPVRQTLEQAAMEMAQEKMRQAEAEEARVKQAYLAEKQADSQNFGYGQAGAKAFNQTLETDEKTVDQARQEFQAAYEAGVVNMSREKTGIMSTTQELAYNAGQADLVQTQTTDKAKAQVATVNGRAGFDVADMSFDTLPKGVKPAALPADVTELQVKTVDSLAKNMGVNVRLVSGLKGNAEIRGNTVLIDADFNRKQAGQNRSIVFYAAHEIGMHRMMKLAPEQGRAFVNAIIADANANLPARMTTETEQRQADYAEQGVYLSISDAMEEVAADKIMDLYDSEEAFAAAIDRIVNGKDEQAKQGVKQYKNALDFVVQKLKELVAKLKGQEKVETQRTLAEVEQLRDMYERALKAAMDKANGLKATKNATQEGDVQVQHSIEEVNGYRYVQADRQVLFGDDPSQWGKQIETFINEQIRKGEDVLFPTADGHILALTERSAYKLSDRHKGKIGKKARALLSDDSFALKGRIAGHIDELIQVGTFDGYEEDIDGSHENDIGEDGFHYYKAYFKDGGENGGYYQVDFSSGLNGEEETAYSIGNITKRKFPSRHGSSGNAGALSGTRKPSGNTNTTKSQKSQEKTPMQLAYEAAMRKQQEEGQHSLKIDTDGRTLSEGQQEYFKDSKARDAQGNLLTLYHGTRKGGFTTFRDWTYLTASESYAKRYADKDTGETMYEVYANITKPFDTRLKECRDLWRNEFFGNYSRTELQETGLPDWTDGYDLAEWIEENDYGFDAILLDEGADIDHKGEVKERGISYVVRSSEQIKRVDNKNPTSDPDIRFSLKNQDDMLKQNAKLKEVNQELRDQFKTTKFAKVDKKALRQFTKQLLKDYQSGADIDETRDTLDGVFTYIANGENGESAVWEVAYERAYDAAVSILSNSSTLNDELFQAYKGMREDIKTTGITINKMYDHDLIGYESINEFRRANFGRIKLVNDGIPVDVFYEGLAYSYPEFFDSDTYMTQADQLSHIEEVLNNLQPTEVNPYSRNMREAATWLANDIMERYFELPQAKPTFADKAERKLTKQAIKDAEKLERLREQKNERIAELIEERREKVKEVTRKEKEKRDQKIREVKERYREKESKSSESRKAKILRERIIRHTQEMSQTLLRPSDKRHIPESLRAPVAAVLDAINLESQYTIDPATGKRQKNVPGDPTKRTLAFTDLRKAYQNIIQDDGADITVDPAMEAMLDLVIDLRDVKLADMNMSQLKTVWDVVRVVEHTINNAGRLLSETKYARTAEWAHAMVKDTETKRAKKGSAVEGLRIDLENPYTFFNHYGESGKAVYRMLRDAQDKQQLMVENVREKVQAIVDPKTVRKLEKEVHEITTERGDKLTLTTAQVMDIYLLTKRQQAQEHLMSGGIVQPEVKSKKIKRGTDAILLSANDLSAIIGKMGAKQKKIADKLQELTRTTLADYGNEASMKAYGYKKFTGDDYWPIKSAREGVHSNIEKGGNNTRSIKNIGLAKSVVPNANNPLDIGGAFQTFASHAADMTDYAAWLCPMEDANRMFNFQFRDEFGNRTGKTIKGLLDRIGGKGSQQYWHRLMEDIQNGIKASADTTAMKAVDKVIGNARGASVGANIRVVVQQPTAIMRAASVLTPEAMFRGLFVGGGWKTAVKYSPIAMRKDMGGFDISSPMQMNDILYDSKTALERVNEAAMWGAGKADAITWGRIWNACEAEIKWDREELPYRSQEFYEAVNELFSEVIDQSQVVDGVLQRSQAMRSGNALMKQATAFMGEPTMALNMMLRAYDDLRNETNKSKRSKAIKGFGKTAFVLLATNAINALAQSLVDAARDDEDDEYWKKFWAAFAGITGEEESAWEKATAFVLSGNFGSSLNPATYVPFAKDAISILQGYNVTRADADVMGDIIDATITFIDSVEGNGKRTTAYAVKNLAQQVGKVFGISATNILRDVWGIARSIAAATKNIPLQYEMEKAVYKIGNEKNISRFVDILYKAYKEDESTYNQIYNDLIDSGIDAEDIRNKMENAMKKEQGINKAGDLEHRYLNPKLQSEYDSKMGAIQKSKLWSKATDKQKDNVEDNLYELITGTNAGQKMQDKIDGGEAVGLTDAEYLLYRLALEMHDKPTENGKYGTFTQEEAEAAISAISGLTSAERAYLWQSTNSSWKDKNNPYK